MDVGVGITPLQVATPLEPRADILDRGPQTPTGRLMQMFRPDTPLPGSRALKQVPVHLLD